MEYYLFSTYVLTASPVFPPSASSYRFVVNLLQAHDASSSTSTSSARSGGSSRSLTHLSNPNVLLATLPTRIQTSLLRNGSILEEVLKEGYPGDLIEVEFKVEPTQHNITRIRRLEEPLTLMLRTINVSGRNTISSFT